MKSKFNKWLATSALALTGALVAIALTPSGALAQDAFKIGVLTDLSGAGSDLAGKGSVLAAKFAVEDYGGKVLGKPIEILSADTLNKPDVASAITRQWIDEEGVKALFDLPITSISLAAIEIAKTRNVAVLSSGSASSDLTGKYCSDIYAHWAYDTYALASGTGRALTQQSDDKGWFFLTADYTFGYNLENDATAAIIAEGGSVIGAVRHPRETPDMTSFLFQAQSSGATNIALANSSADTTLAVKQAAEMGLAAQGLNVAALLATIGDIHSLGLDASQGLTLTEAFYWDFDDQTRAWSERFAKEMNGRRPTMIQAGVYSSIMNYLKAVDESGVDGGREVLNHMRTMKIEDMFARNGVLREDGLMQHDMFLFRVKKPEESTGPWDYYHVLKTIPGAEAFRSLADSECYLVKK